MESFNSGLESLDPFELGENPNYRSVRIRDVTFDSKGAMWSITSYVAKGLKRSVDDGGKVLIFCLWCHLQQRQLVTLNSKYHSMMKFILDSSSG